MEISWNVENVTIRVLSDDSIWFYRFSPSGNYGISNDLYLDDDISKLPAYEEYKGQGPMAEHAKEQLYDIGMETEPLSTKSEYLRKIFICH